MIYFSDKELDDFLLEDIYRGDLTTRVLGVEKVPAKIEFKRKNAGVVAGISVAERLLKKLDITPQIYVSEGESVKADAVLLSAVDSADKLQQAWKVVQLVLEWSCGVAQYTAEMIANAKAINPNAVLAAGGHIHRQGVSETVLVFTNHRNLLAEPNNWVHLVETLKREAPENKITLEADNFAQFEQMITASPDIIQLDKWSVEDVKAALDLINAQDKNITLSVAGGVNKNNVANYAKLGINLFITSAPYYAAPEDIKVVITKA